MNVQWTNEDGQKQETPAINISMHGVKFEAQDVKAASVTRIICPNMDVALGVKKSQIVRHDDSSAVAMLVEFDNNLDDWMRWVEIITRIDQTAVVK
jgi:hypothetical protein